jgi:DnaJ like chaperone protein
MPMLFGKLIGGVLGYLVLGWLGALIGIFVGHAFDRGLASVAGFTAGGASVELQRQFFEAVFTVMGRLAKVDGLISEAEIKQAEAIISQLGLSEEHRREAIELFQRGAKADFIIEETLLPFKKGCQQHPRLIELFLSFLLVMAHADGQLHETEIELLKQIANTLGLSPQQFALWLNMATAQSQFHGGRHQSNDRHRGSQQSAGSPSRADALADAYKALGVTSAASDAEIKKAYRKLMSQYHPDKLIAQGVPEDMIRLGTEKAQEIQAAYDLVVKSRA